MGSTRETGPAMFVPLDEPPPEFAALPSMTPDELAVLYRHGRVPESLCELDGDYRGRVLALSGPLGRGLLAITSRRLAGWSRLPWRGKRFAAIDETSGTGHNRLRLARERDAIRFATRVEPSLIDDRPCIRLDYGDPSHPRAIRRLRDEIRCIGPGLYLGPAFYEVGERPRLLGHFALERL